MGSFFIDEPPVVFCAALAMVVGTDEAVMLQQIHFWLNNSRETFYEGGKWWIKNPYKRLIKCHHFLIWDEQTIKDRMNILVDKRYLVCQSPDVTMKIFTIDYDYISDLFDS